MEELIRLSVEVLITSVLIALLMFGLLIKRKKGLLVVVERGFLLVATVVVALYGTPITIDLSVCAEGQETYETLLGGQRDCSDEEVAKAPPWGTELRGWMPLLWGTPSESENKKAG